MYLSATNKGENMNALLAGTALFLTINIIFWGVFNLITWATERHYDRLACKQRHPATRSKMMVQP
jgi:hypothetical protein